MAFSIQQPHMNYFFIIIIIYYHFYLFLLANSYEPLVVSVSVLNHVICKNWGNFQRKGGGEFT